MSELRQLVWLKAEEVPKLPDGWLALPTEEACVQLKPGKLYETKTVLNIGKVPVINQSLSEFLGFHNDEPGVHASPECPVVTFANHTCAMRLMKLPFSSIQNVFPKIGKPGVTDTIYFYYASLGRVGLSDYKGHHPIFRKAFIPIPPLPEQKRIAGILSAYDELIDNSQRRIKLLETMARNLYREWFVHFRYPGHENTPLIPSPLGNIPKGWEVKTVADSIEISGGGTPSRKEEKYWVGGTIQWFSPSDLTGAGTMFMDDSSDHITKLGLAESSARLFPARSVMLTSRATIGAIAINTHEACTNQGFITCLPNKHAPLYFLFHWLTENVPTFQRMASGATFKEISRGVFKTIEFLQPPVKLVSRFEDTAAPMAEQALALQRQIQNLRKTRDLLLPRLLSGQIPLNTPATEVA